MACLLVNKISNDVGVVLQQALLIITKLKNQTIFGTPSGYNQRARAKAIWPSALEWVYKEVMQGIIQLYAYKAFE